MSDNKKNVDGLEFEVNEDFTQSWEAFTMIRKFNSDDLSVYDKLDLSFQLIELATGIKQEEIVQHCGGDKAPAVDVINFAARIVVAIAPKNSQDSQLS